MLGIIVVFLVVFILWAGSWQRRRLLPYVAVASVLIVITLGYFVDSRYLLTAETGVESAGSRFTGNALFGPFWLLSQVGLFGFGVGAKTQGGQHMGVAIPTISMEGGFEKVLIELGAVGAIAFLVFFFALAKGIRQCLRRARAARLEPIAPAALLAFLTANAATALVAFQIYGDPFVVFLLGFAGGLLLSTSRLAEQAVRRESGSRSNEERLPGLTEAAGVP